MRLLLALDGRLLLLIAISDHDECHTRRRGVKGQDTAARCEGEESGFSARGLLLNACGRGFASQSCEATASNTHNEHARRLQRHEKSRE